MVLRSEWVVLRSIFSEAFGIQKGAYRRAHGGKTAPSLQDSRTGKPPFFVFYVRGMISWKVSWEFWVGEVVLGIHVLHVWMGEVRFVLILPVGPWSAILKERQI